jgi:broad specificity phosphatase PhoE
MRIALVPCGNTEWQDEGRILGRVELPLSSEGQQQCCEWARELSPLGLQRILHAPDELATQTAGVLARQLSIPTRALDDLVEVDLGLWAGLTEAQLKSRYASAHRQLRESPLNVSPPGGESLDEAARRLNGCIRKQLRKNGNQAIAMVLRPFTFAMVKCALEGREAAEVWETARHAHGPVVIECERADVSSPQLSD